MNSPKAAREGLLFFATHPRRPKIDYLYTVKKFTLEKDTAALTDQKSMPNLFIGKGARSKREKIRRNGRREKRSGKRNFDRLCSEDFQIREHRMILLLVTK